MAYNTVGGSASKDKDIVLYDQLKASVYKAIVKNVDGKTAASTLIFTTDNGAKRFHPIMIRVVVSSAITITVVPTVSVGANSPDYNDILGATVLTSLTAVNKMSNFDIAIAANSVAANTGVYVKVTGIATATTCNIDVAVFGDYE